MRILFQFGGEQVMLNYALVRSFLPGLTLLACLAMVAGPVTANDLVYSYRGVLPPGASSHSSVADGETFTAIFTIDPAVADADPLPERGIFPACGISGALVFSGGYVAPINLDGGTAVVFDNFSNDGEVFDGIQFRLGDDVMMQASTRQLETIASDNLPAAGLEFDSSPDPDTINFVQLTYTDAGGTIIYTGSTAHNVRFVSKDAIAFSNVAGASPFYCLGSSWLTGIDGGPPSTTDTAWFSLFSTYDVAWSDICFANNTVEDLCITYGDVTFDNRDSGNYMLTVTNDAEIDGPARLNLGDGTTGTVDLDVGGFLVVDGRLNALTGTSIAAGLADIGRDDYGRIMIDGPETLLSTGASAMYIGVSDLGDLVITGGAVATDAGSPRIGAFADGNGWVTVSGTDSLWNVLGDIEIGNYPETVGFLVVGSNSAVTAGNSILAGVSGDQLNSIVVDDSLLSAGGDIVIGGTGNAVLSLLANGEAIAGGQILIATNGTVEAVGTGGVPDLFASSIVIDGHLDLYGESIGCDVNPDVFNNGSIHSFAPAVNVFYSSVVHDGLEIRTDAGAETQFIGTASGAGNYTGTGSLVFVGDLKPGSGTGQGTVAAISLEGDVLLSGSTFHVDVGAALPNGFDSLSIAGGLNLSAGSTLSVSMIGDFVPCDGDKFMIAKIDGALMGTFAGLSEGALVGTYGGVDLTITYRGGDGNDIVLVASGGPFLLGDVNLDCAVNLLDVQPFIDLLVSGGYQAEADINEDGFVDLLDVDPFVGLLAGSTP